jgi:hypothetical protein
MVDCLPKGARAMQNTSAIHSFDAVNAANPAVWFIQYVGYPTIPKTVVKDKGHVMNDRGLFYVC